VLHPLRHLVLRVGLPLETAVIDGDDEPTTRHVGVFDQNGLIIGCASIIQRPWNDRMSWRLRGMAILRLNPKPPTRGEAAWRLRGMAVDAGLRGRGIGRAMLSRIEQIVIAADYPPLLWCCARKPAVGFYAAMRWTKIGSEFYDENAGPHFLMYKRLQQTPGKGA
jgi:GNAT superfamily N-acetyltransferase